ncbi:hypothetical protein RQP53_16910 [Paucibacter sp. APW11]|uniref:Uncharacterized protein n=1 Tax=Roseateles aquae TaxID=3077235 RepID=A0ABU3PEB9_9BURK|nr:hypothetical protein [Paucibacter sp. APW11]MDT9000960.1 hypothetical protein [Paucibacter sp. APW11]
MPLRRIDALARTLFGLVTLSLLCAAPAQAQYNARAQANYKSEGLDLRLIWLDRQTASAALSATLTQGACSASIAGIGQMSKRRLVIEPYRKLPRGEDCRLTLDFDEAWNKVSSSTEGNCAPYGGAGCEFDGQSAARQRP